MGTGRIQRQFEVIKIELGKAPDFVFQRFDRKIHGTVSHITPLLGCGSTRIIF
jgi:hypothetical protein